MANNLTKSALYSSFLFVSSVMGWILPTMCYAQSPSLSLSKEKVNLTNASSFYILDVIDKRKSKSPQLGEVYVYGQPRPLVMAQPLHQHLFEHWTYSMRERKDDSLPLEIVLDEVSISERKIAPNKISGEMKVKITFQWTRSATTIFLTNYSTATTYTRPETQYEYEPIFRRMLDGGLRHFDQWIGINEEKNPLLARGIKLVVWDGDYAEQSDTVFFQPARKLTWSDFKGSSNQPGRRYAAAVFSSFSYEGNSKMVGKYLQVTISTKVFMVKSMSWGKMEARNTYTLTHEQTHFDITRIIAEQFKEKLKKMDLTLEYYDSQIQYEFIESFRAMHTMQEKYDGETQHGLNTTLQADWNQKIKTEIERIYRES